MSLSQLLPSKSCFTLLGFLLMTCWLPIQAQKDTAYVPFPTGKAVWAHKADYYLRNLSRPDFTYTFHYCQCGADTLIDGKTYRKISYLRPEFEAVPDIVALREEDKRIYYRPLRKDCPVKGEADILLYDFNLKQNDTLKLFREEYPNFICAGSGMKLPFKLLKIDTVEHWGKRKAGHIYDIFIPLSMFSIDTIFEGVGGINGLLTPIHYFPEDPGFPQRTLTYLTGFSQDSTLADSLCKIIRNGVIRGRTASLLSGKINCSYQDGSLMVGFSGEHLPTQNALKIFNLYGQCLFNQTTSQKQIIIDSSSWANGLYYLQIESDRQTIYSEKVWIHR